MSTVGLSAAGLRTLSRHITGEAVCIEAEPNDDGTVQVFVDQVYDAGSTDELQERVIFTMSAGGEKMLAVHDRFGTLIEELPEPSVRG